MAMLKSRSSRQAGNDAVHPIWSTNTAVKSDLPSGRMDYVDDVMSEYAGIADSIAHLSCHAGIDQGRSYRHIWSRKFASEVLPPLQRLVQSCQDSILVAFRIIEKGICLRIASAFSAYGLLTGVCMLFKLLCWMWQDTARRFISAAVVHLSADQLLCCAAMPALSL